MEKEGSSQSILDVQSHQDQALDAKKELGHDQPKPFEYTVPPSSLPLIDSASSANKSRKLLPQGSDPEKGPNTSPPDSRKELSKEEKFKKEVTKPKEGITSKTKDVKEGFVDKLGLKDLKLKGIFGRSKKEKEQNEDARSGSEQNTETQDVTAKTSFNGFPVQKKKDETPSDKSENDSASTNSAPKFPTSSDQPQTNSGTKDYNPSNGKTETTHANPLSQIPEKTAKVTKKAKSGLTGKFPKCFSDPEPNSNATATNNIYKNVYNPIHDSKPSEAKKANKSNLLLELTKLYTKDPEAYNELVKIPPNHFYPVE